MRLLGDRVLVKREPKAESSGFEQVQAVDDFVGRGVVAMVGEGADPGFTEPRFKEGQVVVFAKFSPDTRTIEHEGEEMKSVLTRDIIAII